MNSHVLHDLVGRTVTAVWWSEDHLTFETDGGPLTYRVEGDCCSHSYFHDLIGLDKLTAGPVVSVHTVDLTDEEQRAIEREADAKSRAEGNYGIESLQVYGYQIVTEHPAFGEVTTAVSFRNESNGYYGGWMERAATDSVRPEQECLLADKIG